MSKVLEEIEKKEALKYFRKEHSETYKEFQLEELALKIQIRELRKQLITRAVISYRVSNEPLTYQEWKEMMAEE